MVRQAEHFVVLSQVLHPVNWQSVLHALFASVVQPVVHREHWFATSHLMQLLREAVPQATQVVSSAVGIFPASHDKDLEKGQRVERIISNTIGFIKKKKKVYCFFIVFVIILGMIFGFI